MKNIYCIRHGLAEHNINYHKYGVQTFYDPNYVDTKLLTHGFKQASELRETWEDINNIELVIVSPLRRTLQTANELFKGINKNKGFYFIHSYYIDVKNKNNIMTTTEYGIDFVSGINSSNIYAVQFHPEKSHSNGLKLLKNFSEMTYVKT